MDRSQKRRYFVEYIHDEDPSIRKTFSAETTGPTSAEEKVNEYIKAHNLHVPEGKNNYCLRIRKLRERDTVQYPIPA